MTQENRDPECREDALKQESAKQESAPESAAGHDTESQAVPEAPEQPEETFTLTRGQMEQLELAAKELETLKDQHLRLRAEYDNYRKRTAREKEALWTEAKADTVLKLLPVCDSLARAAAVEGDDENPHKQGLVKIFQQCQEVLKSLGVTEIDALGKPFDPEKHNAVMHIDDERYGENEVSQVFQSGFLLGDKVIRPATVQVAN